MAVCGILGDKPRRKDVDSRKLGCVLQFDGQLAVRRVDRFDLDWSECRSFQLSCRTNDKSAQPFPFGQSNSNAMTRRLQQQVVVTCGQFFNRDQS